MFRALIVTFAAILLSGCATQAQRQAESMTNNTISAVAGLLACTQAVYQSSDFDPIRERTPIDSREITLAQLAYTGMITKSESDAVLKVHPRLQQCRRSYLEQIAMTTPTLVPIYADAWTKNDAALVALLQKKISWGEELRLTQQLSIETSARTMAEAQRIDAGLERSHEAELARRQAAANALAAYAQQQQAIANANRPITTNCRALGNSVNCVTQ